jgi:hypothetical protein
VTEKSNTAQLLVLVFDQADQQAALEVQAEAISSGYLVRLEPKPKKLNVLLDSLKYHGFEHFAVLDEPKSGFQGLKIKPIG